MSSKSIYRFYVYAYLRKDGSPYYIGKGVDERAYAPHIRGQGSITPSDKSRIVFLEKNLSNVGACALERRYIAWYGRKDLGTGILRNLTDGGDGTRGIRRTISEETRAKIAATNTGKTHSESTKDKMRKSHANKSEEAKAELAKIRSAIRKGRKWVNNGEVNVRCYPDQLDCYLSMGYVSGRIPWKDDTK